MSLTFSVLVPVTNNSWGPPAGSAGSVAFHSPVASAKAPVDFPANSTLTDSPGAAQPHPEAPSAALRLRIDHRGVHLEGECPAPPPGATLALVPTEAEGQLPAAAWVERLAADGLVVLALPPLASAPALDLGVHLQVQRLAVEARASGALVAAGAADLGYFRERWRKHGESSRRSP